MNKHFEDTRYYVKRAGETAKKGISEELEPVEQRVKKLAGKEEEPEPGRLEELRADLKELQGRAEGEAKEAIGKAREKMETVRERRAK
jgi:chaperonin cofactor prefoldin